MWWMAASKYPPVSQRLPGRKVANGFQIAGYVSPGLINLHLEKSCLLEEFRAEHISFHSTKLFPQGSSS